MCTNQHKMESKQLHTSFLLYKKRKDKKGNSPILFRITIDGVRETLSTGITCMESDWNEAKSRVNPGIQDAIYKNNLLAALENKALFIYTNLIQASKPITSSIIKAKLTGLDENNVTLLVAFKEHEDYVRKRIGIEVSEALLIKYQSLKMKVESYLKIQLKRNDILLSKLGHQFVLNFEVFLKTHEKIKHNTAVKYIQFLKRITNYSIANEWLKTDPFKGYKCSFKQVYRECLTQHEIDLIKAKEFDSTRLEYVRDIFIFSVYTGLAYADIKKLTLKEIIPDTNGKLWIQTFRTKTKTRVPVLLLKPAIELINKFQIWREDEKTVRVFPVPSNQKVNEYLKEIATLCAISKRLTFHIARHSFATTITLNNGVPIESVSKMLGHTNIKTTQIYAKVMDTKIAEDMEALSQRINIQNSSK